MTRIAAPVDVVAAYLSAPQRMPEWDTELCERGQELRQLNPDAVLGHLEYYGETALGMTVVSPRNLVLLTVRARAPCGAILVASTSVPDALGPPPAKGSVRANLVSGGGVVKAVAGNPGLCDVFFMTQVDFGGSLPKSIVAMVAKTSPLALAVARKILEKK